MSDGEAADFLELVVCKAQARKVLPTARRPRKPTVSASDLGTRLRALGPLPPSCQLGLWDPRAWGGTQGSVVAQGRFGRKGEVLGCVEVQYLLGLGEEVLLVGLRSRAQGRG